MLMTQTLHCCVKLSIVDIVALFSLVQLLAKESDKMTFGSTPPLHTPDASQTTSNTLEKSGEAKDRGISQFLLNFFESVSS